jgi:hypothetical protein
LVISTELDARRSRQLTDSADDVEVARGAATQNDLSRDLVLGGVGDSVGLSGLDARLGEFVDGDGGLRGDGSDHGRARENDVEETHDDGIGGESWVGD